MYVYSLYDTHRCAELRKTATQLSSILHGEFAQIAETKSVPLNVEHSKKLFALTEEAHQRLLSLPFRTNRTAFNPITCYLNADREIVDFSIRLFEPVSYSVTQTSSSTTPSPSLPEKSTSSFIVPENIDSTTDYASYTPRPIDYRACELKPTAISMFEDEDSIDFTAERIEYPVLMDGLLPYAPLHMPLTLISGASASGKSLFSLLALSYAHRYRQTRAPDTPVFMVYVSIDSEPNLVVQEALKLGLSEDLIKHCLKFPRNTRFAKEDQESKFCIDDAEDIAILDRYLGKLSQHGIVAGVVIDALSTALKKTKLNDSEIVSHLRAIGLLGKKYEAPIFLIHHLSKEQIKNAGVIASPEQVTLGSGQIAAQARHIIAITNTGEHRLATVVKSMDHSLFPIHNNQMVLQLEEGVGMKVIPVAASPISGKAGTNVEVILQHLRELRSSGQTEIPFKQILAWAKERGISEKTALRAIDFSVSDCWRKVVDHTLGKNQKKLVSSIDQGIRFIEANTLHGGAK